MRRSALCPSRGGRYPLHLPLPHVPEAEWKLLRGLAGVEVKHFEVTRGEVAYFRSSDIGDRGFCRDCGTPLVYRYTSEARVAVTLGSLDDPAKLKPVVQYGVESRMPWFSELAMLPATEADDPETCENIRRSNRQHPDHDTATWPPQK